LNVVITKTVFEDRCKDLFEKCFDSVKEALNDAGLNKKDINDIVLVGGSSRIPKIQEMIKQ
jgi:molecular chaperone DnaK (HSP70)